ncbi:MAG: hypothetical protein IJG13_03110 [Kiritimatiellae bacterium]|nr:hypothetical protein [Kiritimatiellia bacterium]
MMWTENIVTGSKRRDTANLIRVASILALLCAGRVSSASAGYANGAAWRADFASPGAWQCVTGHLGRVKFEFGAEDGFGREALLVSGAVTSRCETAWRICSGRIPYDGKAKKYEFSAELAASKSMWKVVDGGEWISCVKWFDEDGRELARHRIPLQYPRSPARVVMVEQMPSGSSFFEVQLGQVAPIIANGEWIRISDMRLSEMPVEARCLRSSPDVRPPRVRVADPGPTADVWRPLRLVVQDPSGVDWFSIAIAVDGTECTRLFRREGDAMILERPSAPWTSGVHKISVSVSDRCGNAVDAAKSFVIGNAPNAKGTSLRDDGVLLVGGQPFFPIGIYGVGKQAFNAYDLDRAVSDLKAAGFNTVQSYIFGRDPEFLEAVGRHGMKMWTDARKPDDDFVERIRFNPDVIAWYLGDDTFDNTTPEQLHDRDDYMKAFDPSRLTCQADPVWSYSTVDRYCHYAAATDVFLPEIYPVRGKSEDEDRACVAFVIRDMRRIAADNRAFGGKRAHATWPIIQEFCGWSSWKRMPREDEFYGMCFAALVHGAKGITLYTYGGGLGAGVEVPGTPVKNIGVTLSENIWRATTNVSRRISSLAPVLLERDGPQPPPPEIMSGPQRDALDEGPSVTMLEKLHGGWTYILAVNAADAQVKARFSVGAAGPVEVLWERRSPASAGGGAFEDVFAPLDVHVYRFRK